MKVEEGIFSEGGVDYPYVVLRQEYEDRLPNFVGLLSGRLMISDATPAEHRPYIFAHEIICRVTLAGRGRCLKALQIELSRVPEEIKSAYVQFRREFFEGLVRFYADSDCGEFKLELQTSLDFLRTL